MTTPDDSEMTGATPDHGVRVFDADLRTATPMARGKFFVCRTSRGRWYACIHVQTALGHLQTCIHLERDAVNLLLAPQVAPAAPAPTATEWMSPAYPTHAVGAVHLGHVAHTLERDAAPVVRSLAHVANQTAHAINAAAATTEHGIDRETHAAARIVARAHLGDINAGNFIKGIANDARAGVHDAQHVANALAKGAEFVTNHVDMPKILADAIPVPAVRRAAQSVIGMVDPLDKFSHAVDALRRGDLKALRAMAQQELSEMQGVVSLVPGVGSGISAAMGVAEGLLDGGSPLDMAIRAAYGAIPIPPGVRQITDTVLDAILQFVKNPHSLTDAALVVARDRVPSGIPRDVFDTLAHVIAHHQPIGKAAAELAGHYVKQYTQGIGPALEHGLANVVAPEVSTVLRKLPAASTRFAGFNPGLKRIAHVAADLRASAPRIPAPIAPPTTAGGRGRPAPPRSYAHGHEWAHGYAEHGRHDPHYGEYAGDWPAWRGAWDAPAVAYEGEGQELAELAAEQTGARRTAPPRGYARAHYGHGYGRPWRPAPPLSQFPPAPPSPTPDDGGAPPEYEGEDELGEIDQQTGAWGPAPPTGQRRYGRRFARHHQPHWPYGRQHQRPAPPTGQLGLPYGAAPPVAPPSPMAPAAPDAAGPASVDASALADADQGDADADASELEDVNATVDESTPDTTATGQSLDLENPETTGHHQHHHHPGHHRHRHEWDHFHARTGQSVDLGNPETTGQSLDLGNPETAGRGFGGRGGWRGFRRGGFAPFGGGGGEGWWGRSAYHVDEYAAPPMYEAPPVPEYVAPPTGQF